MKSISRLILPLLIIAPTIVLGLVAIPPRPIALIDAWNQARLFETNDQGIRAIPYYHQILEYQPQRYDLWEKIGTHEYAAGDYDQALESFLTAAKHSALTPSGIFALGNAYYELGKIDEASQTWLMILTQNDVDVELITKVTSNLRKAGKFTEAAEAGQCWLERDPQSTEAAWQTGLLLAIQDPSAAIDPLAVASVGEGAEASMAAQLQETITEALKVSDRAYQLVIIGQRLGELGQWDIAEEAFVKATRLSPEYAEAWALLGETQQNLGKDGWTSLLRAKTIDPDSDIVLSALVVYWKRQEKYNVAITYLRYLASKHPQEGRWQIEIGSTYALAGDLIQGMAAYQQAVIIEPKNADLWCSLAVFSATYGFDSATFSVPAIERALDLAPNDPAVLDGAGWIYLLQGDLEKAEQFLQQALKEDGDFGSARLHLAQVYIETNRLSQALPLLKAAVNQENEPTVGLQAQRLLEKYFPGQ